MAIDKTIKLGLDAEDVIKKLENIEKELQGVKKGVEGGTQEMGKLNKSTNIVAKGMTSLAGGIGFVAVALKALAITGIMRLFDMFFNLLNNNQVVLDATNKAFETINISLKAVVGSLTSLQTDGLLQGFFDWWKENIIDLMLSPLTNVIEGVGLLGKAIGKLFKKEFKEAAELALAGAQKIRSGVLIVPAVMGQLKDSTDEATAALKKQLLEAKALADQIVELRNEVQLLEADQRIIQLTTLKNAEDQRQIRDDVSKGIEDRIEANKKLGDILEKGFQDELLIAGEKLRLAKLVESTDTKNIQLISDRKNAEADILEIQERITGLTSEQKVNEVALNDERVANLQELSSIGKTELERQINDIEIQAEQKRILARRTISDEKELQNTLVKINKDAADKKTQIQRLESTTKRDIIASTLGQIGELIGSESKEAKALAIAATLINTYSAAANALAPVASGGAGPIWGIPVAIGAIASGLANVAKIRSTKLPGVDSGGGTGPTPSVPQGVGSLGASLIPNVEGIQGSPVGAVAPVPAYVVENDISNAQALQDELEIQATL